jgi:hypothetical protein
MCFDFELNVRLIIMLLNFYKIKHDEKYAHI